MKHLSWLYHGLNSVKRFGLSKGFMIALSAVLLLGGCAVIAENTRLGRSLFQPDSDLSTAKETASLGAQLSTAQTAAPTTSDTTSSPAPPPMNRPGNRYVDENSSGPVKLTYNEKKSLVISPATLTVYTTSGAPVPNDAFGMVYQRLQVASDDGQVIEYPQAANAGGVFFGVQTTGTSTTAPSYASWPFTTDAQRAVPGNYTVTFTSWSLDRQTRYTGSMQLVVEQLPATP